MKIMGHGFDPVASTAALLVLAGATHPQALSPKARWSAQFGLPGADSRIKALAFFDTGLGHPITPWRSPPRSAELLHRKLWNRRTAFACRPASFSSLETASKAASTPGSSMKTLRALTASLRTPWSLEALSI